ncbi:TetR family transcriptional regulator [Leptospira kobayashii]|uniref:TetR family transcriptional regulator n=1 Tax=Leptospira kobayashii TaxID=1917830 RepID=A0ABM7UFX6_9LEPT|nr:TetR/AcrR family transcriptional regulator [Leptospira kobayashii]BDA77490.1 TetR family transcriptional regulator [Leptospira kobayashii]
MGKGEETKSIILNRAVQIASKEGLDGLTIGTLADDLGMSKSGIFGKFQSKETLQIEVLKVGSEMFRRNVIYPVLKSEPGLKRIRTLFITWLEWIEGDALPGGCLVLGSISTYDDKPGAVRDYLVKVESELMRLIERFLSEVKADKILKPGFKSDFFIQELWGIILGFQLYHRFFQDAKSKTRAKSSFEELIQRSLA